MTKTAKDRATRKTLSKKLLEAASRNDCAEVSHTNV